MRQQLGAGAFGETWRAFDLEQRTEVAVKLFKAFGGIGYLTGADRYRVAGAEQECRLVQEMLEENGTFPAGKAHICRCLESHVSDQAVDEPIFIVMEHCGTSLQQKVEGQQRSAPDPDFVLRVRRWMAGSLMAIRFMSGLERPVQHRDLSATNIVADDATNEARLIDFGVAARVDTASQGPTWRVDAADLAMVYGRALCLGTGAISVGSGKGHCRGGGPGVGSPEDWAAVHALYAGASSIEELAALLPAPSA